MDRPSAGTVEPDAISDRDLVLNFESIGDNCEFGLVQRKAGAEPLGLLRFSSAPVPLLVRALHARFDGLADSANVRVWAAKGEYLIGLSKYDFVYHADARVGDIDPDTLHKQQIRTLPFLVKKLIGDLERPEKILVFRQNEPLGANDFIDLRTALARYGPATLLWVQEARPGHPPGSVDVVDDTLMVGYVRRFASRENVPDLDVASWLVTLRRAYTLWRARPARSRDLMASPVATPPVNQAPSSVEIVFGIGGNALGVTQYGWSPAEDRHTFAIDDRSLLTFAPPSEAPEYRLEMDIAPFLAPPALTSQRLEVMVNGSLVQILDPVPSGLVVTSVPGRLVSGQDRVDILLLHPRAARPCDVGVSPDTRRLAIMVRRLTLTGIRPLASARPAAIEMLFGVGNEPRSEAEFGWSSPEADFAWAIDERSLLLLTPPADAANYRLELDMLPFVHPPELNAQSLSVMVNDTLVQAFDPVAHGRSVCHVPGELVRGRDKLRILLLHPRAASPSALGLGGDSRRLALMFRRLSLAALPD